MFVEKVFQLIVYRLKKSPVLVKQREGGKWTGRDNLLCTRQFAIPTKLHGTFEHKRSISDSDGQ